jgi:hypothetical protein
MRIESSIRVISADRTSEQRTAKERQNPRFRRDGLRKTVDTQIDSLAIGMVLPIRAAAKFPSTSKSGRKPTPAWRACSSASICRVTSMPAERWN